MTSTNNKSRRYKFCIVLRGNLSVIAGSTMICVELEGCEDVRKLVEKVFFEKKMQVSMENIVLVYNNESIGDEVTTCDINMVEAYLMYQGG